VWVRDHGGHGLWVEGPADLVERLAPRWAEALGAPVRGWVVRVLRAERGLQGGAVRGGRSRTEVRGLRWDPAREPVVLAEADDDEDEDESDAPPDEIARERLQIVLEMYEQLHEDDARVEPL
jgi:hypothetical protein